MDLKHISPKSIPRALELAERYRLLNEPEQAVSICRDVLEADPANQEALKMLLLALTDEFGGTLGTSLKETDEVAERLTDIYERAYYRGIVYERWGRSRLRSSDPIHVAGDWIRRAMELYEEAEAHKPVNDDSALLRWNACARLAQRNPSIMDSGEVHELHLGD